MTSRAVLVTGGAAGIGWATARRFAAAGDRVLIADIDGARAAARALDLGADHRAVSADVANPLDVDAVVEACVAAFGRIDVLINNAGRIDSSGTAIVDQPTDAFRNLIALNLEGTINVAEAAARAMQAKGAGAIVNVASGAALRAIPLRNAYSASKAAVVAATRNLACRLASSGIQVNAIAPGYTRTELVDTLIEVGRVDPSKAVQRIPLGRMGRPDEMAEAIYHLASPAARAFVGGLLLVDGGGQIYGGSEDAGVPRGSPPNAPPAGAPVIILSGADADLAVALSREVAMRGAHLVQLDASLDLTDRAAVQTAVQAIVDRHGRIDALVTCSLGKVSGLADGLDGALTAVFHLAQAAGRQMLAQGFGAVCAVTPIAGQIGLPHADGAAETSAAIGMFTRSMACEWGGSGVRANTLMVGPRHADDPLLARMPLRRAITATEIAANIHFLISPAASYVTGAIVSLDGGLSSYSGLDL